MKKKFLIAIIIVVLVVLSTEAFYTVDYKCSVIVTNLGRIVKVEEQPGLHLKIPFLESTQQVYAGSHIYDIPASDVITKDKKSMIADDYVIWRVVDAKKYYQTLGANANRAEERIDAAVYNATKNTISSMTQEAVIAARGSQLTNIITEESNSDIADYGIVISTAEIKALDLPEDNKEAVYERMISERQNIAAGYKAQGNAEAQKIKNQTDKQVSITLANANKEAEEIIAEGEAGYMQILSDAYNSPEKAEFYNYLRGLDALDVALYGNDTTIILDKNSEIVKILYGEN